MKKTAKTAKTEPRRVLLDSTDAAAGAHGGGDLVVHTRLTEADAYVIARVLADESEPTETALRAARRYRELMG